MTSNGQMSLKRKLYCYINKILQKKKHTYIYCIKCLDSQRQMSPTDIDDITHANTNINCLDINVARKKKTRMTMTMSNENKFPLLKLKMMNTIWYHDDEDYETFVCWRMTKSLSY